MFERVKEDNSDSIKKAISVLESGGIIVYPTDTIYGFGCDAKNEKAIERLNKIKGRSAPMSVLCPSFQSVKSWIDLPSHEKAIVEKKNKTKNNFNCTSKKQYCFEPDPREWKYPRN